jgi:hypothetical protein
MCRILPVNPNLPALRIGHHTGSDLMFSKRGIEVCHNAPEGINIFPDMAGYIG